nr:hypothetical protein [Halomonas sp. HL-48]
MPIDPIRRALLRVSSLAGLGALLPLIPSGQAADHRVSPPPASVQVDGWLLRTSDR